MHTENLRNLLRADGLMAIIRGYDPNSCVRCIEVLATRGVRLIEVSLTTTDALRVIERVAGMGLDVELGAGTVRTAADTHRAQSAGATYIVTPATTPGAAAAAALNIPVLCGCLTPTEILVAHDQGYLPKVFPAGVLGSEYVRALSAPLADIETVPVGGIDATAAVAYLRAGALAVGVGSPLIGDATNGGDLSALAERATTYRRAIDGARPS